MFRRSSLCASCSLLLVAVGLLACPADGGPEKSTPAGATAKTPDTGQDTPEPAGVQPEAEKGPPRVVVLGFDGVDPDRVKEYIDAGKLPNLAKLSKEGYFSPLRSTTPPQSPVAWATFATGQAPGFHGIFDFLAPGRGNYFPKVAYQDVGRPEVKAGKLVQGLSAKSLRNGPSFWHRLGKAGVPGSVLFVPYSFPPDGTGPMRVVSGLGTPDVRGTNSSFHYFAHDHFPGDKKPGPVAGGAFVDGKKDPAIQGPPLTRDGKRSGVSLPVSFETAEGKVKVTDPEGSLEVARGTWSPMRSLGFEMVPGTTWHTVTRWYPVAGREDPLAVYLAPLSADPRDPPFTISSPPGFAGELAQRTGGPFKTVGWIHETSGLSTEALDEDGFLSDMLDTMNAREKILHSVLDEDHDQVTIAAFTATDRVAHMFYRLIDKQHPRYDAELAGTHGDAILKVYEKMDAIVGGVMEKLPEGALLFLVSDHGFHSFRRGVNLNRWLVDNGYMVLKGGATEGREFFRDVDWSKTRAYAMGTGQVWLNLVGREAQGSVGPADADPLRAELAEKLMTLKDGEVDAVVGVHQARKTYQGPRINDAPDLTVSFASGYRTGWKSILGGAPAALVEDNERKWSGDHAASDPADTKGFLMSNQKLAVEDPGIEDVAATVMGLYGETAGGPGKAWVK